MKLIQLLSILILSNLSLYGQLVVTEPAIPIETKAVKVIFDATKGTGGLQGYSGDVYAHAGVITDKSNSGSDWKYVKSNWGQNTADTKLTRIGTDLYELNVGPTIRSFYGVPSNEVIIQMAFVFRSADASQTGKDDGGTDIFIDVFSEGFFVQIDQPEDNSIIEQGQLLNFSVSSTEEASLELSINDIIVAQGQGTELNYDQVFETTGDYWVVAIANNGVENTEDTIFVCVRKEVEILAKPAAYKKGVNRLTDNSVALVLWAPHKENIFVLGDFNEWRPLNEYQMKKDGDYFWLEIDNLWANWPYVYQYLIDGELLLADPYTDQVSDPYNDKYISQSVYPGLVKYPFQKTSGLASVLYASEEEYDWTIENFEAEEKEKLIIYELLIRDFHEEHSYAAVIEKLDYLETLGITALELMPVNEFEGNSSWGYNPSFYFAPDKYYGPKNELKRLVDECHKRGIAVIIDMVLNHSYGQSPFAQMYIDGGKPAGNNPWYNREHNFTNPDAHWGYDFNHESVHTQELVDSINAYWMSEYKVDGFRFDFTKGFGNNIKNSSDSWGSKYDADRIALLKRMSDEIWERNPDAYVCFEHLSDNAEEKELANYGILLWGNMNHDYAEAAMGYPSNLTWGLYKARDWNDPNLITYMESHDEERLMYKMTQWGNNSGNYSTKDEIYGAHRIALNNLFFLPLPGPKMIWQFGELGYDISIDHDCRVCEKPILWQYFEEWQRKNIYDVMSNLSYLKRNYDIFSTETFSYSLSGPTKKYQLESNGSYVLAVGNFDVVEKTTNMVFPYKGTWHEYFGKTELEVTETNTFLTLDPGEYRLYSSEPLDWKVEMSPLNIEETENFPVFDKLLVFPNPSRNSIQWEKGLVHVQLFDMSGKLLLEEFSTTYSLNRLDIQTLEAGVYILLGKDKQGYLMHSKVVKE